MMDGSLLMSLSHEQELPSDPYFLYKGGNEKPLITGNLGPIAIIRGVTPQ